MEQKVLTPRPAATVTLVRDAPQGFEVLMVQRNFQSVFMPGMNVFPGGGVDGLDDAFGCQQRAHVGRRRTGCGLRGAGGHERVSEASV